MKFAPGLIEHREGHAVAFPVGIGLALVLGVMLNYWADPTGNATLLFIGVGLIVVAMICSALIIALAIVYSAHLHRYQGVGNPGGFVTFDRATGKLH